MTEHDLHKAVAAYLRLALRAPVFWTSIDAGAGKLSPASAGKAKARGVKAGLPDILVFVPRIGSSIVIGIELKSPIGRLSTVQKDTQGEMMLASVRCRVARSIEDVQEILLANDVTLHAMAGGPKARAA